VAVVDQPVAHQADIAAATELMGEVAQARVQEPDIASDVLEPPTVLGAETVTVDGVMLRLTVKVNPGKQFVVQRALNAAITSALDAAGVPRPGPLEVTLPRDPE
jgi:small conductance mechanosensitive channel